MILPAYVLLAGASAAFGRPHVYDQRQSGKTNVRVEVKDAILIAVGDGELGGDYDYNYDYADLTVKPEKPVLSTATPSTATSTTSTSKKPTSFQPSTTANYSFPQTAAVVLEAENNSIIFPANKPGNLSIKIPPSGFKPEQIPVVVLQETHGNSTNRFLPVKTVEKNYVPSTRIRGKATNGTGSELPPTQCSPGFYLDPRRRCKRPRRPTRERPQLP